jgi:hypothetical protein
MNNLPWIAFLVLTATIFVVLEIWAIATGGTTLSQYIWDLSKVWPLLPFVLGALVGAVAVHLFGQRR